MYDLFYICIETNFAEFEKFCGLITFVRKLGDGFTFLFSPDVILCGWLGSKHQLINKIFVCACDRLVCIPLFCFCYHPSTPSHNIWMSHGCICNKATHVYGTTRAGLLNNDQIKRQYCKCAICSTAVCTYVTYSSMASNATQYCCYAGGEVRGVGVGWNLVTFTDTVCVCVCECVCTCGVCVWCREGMCTRVCWCGRLCNSHYVKSCFILIFNSCF